MKRLIIVCEGATEQEFCKEILKPYFIEKDIMVETPTIKLSSGGIVAWETLKKQLICHLNEQNAIVTLLIDFYGIKDSFRFPGWMEAKKIDASASKMDFLFKQMRSEIKTNLQERFVPYIQLHEFESVLFSDISAFRNCFNDNECKFDEIEHAIKAFPNPENINNGPNTAPSVRLKNAINGYDKVVFGCLLAEEIGLRTIRTRCPLFNNWIERIESAFTQFR